MSNICGSCGANNDSLLTTCLYCESSLVPPKLDQVSDEDLITEGGKWIGRITASHYASAYDESKCIEITENNVNIELSRAEVDSNTNKYISIIQARSLSNPNMKHMLETFKKDIEIAEKKASERVKKDWMQAGGGVGLCLCIYLFVWIVS